MDSLLNEKKKFIRHVLSNAPPGKISDLISNLKIIFGSNAIIQNFIEDIISNYNEDNHILIPFENNEYIIICKQSKSGNLYLHPNLKILANVNHLKRKVIDTTPLIKFDYSDILEKYRQACNNKLKEYVDIYYKKWNEHQTENYPTVNIGSKHGLNVKCASSVYASESENKNNLFLIICCDRYYLKNFHASSWRSSWNVNFLETDQEIPLTGTIDVVLTYFEDANINFKTRKVFEKRVSVTNDVESFASSILSVIRECENDVLYDLNHFIANTSNDLIKNTRKIIPLNGDKFYWMETYQDIPTQIKLI
ncbi:F-actin-capping protein subunit alpha, putative [Plasmodium vinckei lentum]|uniref:F-actin-capping protein subunit alpha n=1 Tax=Plasmodium vinckei lentum TaxID=138297 RepID=A0A6V7S1G2_PLAVN|nr:F-actin-capping protein subunit alpha, putative [Plasmodium vinckei lentum]